MPKSDYVPKLTKYYYRYCCYKPGISEVFVFRANRKHYSVIYKDKSNKDEEWHDFESSKDAAYYLAELRDIGYLVPDTVFPLLLDPIHVNLTELRT